MNTFSPYVAWYGRDEPPPDIVMLKAGKLELEYEKGVLRYIRYADQELIRRVYVALRDQNWNTIPAEISNLSITGKDDSFIIQFTASHHDQSIHFHWLATITGTPDGIIEYKMDGRADSEFRYCRIGLCILHPLDGITGQPYRAITPDGEIRSTLPKYIEPQRIVENSYELPIFPSCSSIAVDTSSGVSVITDFEGDLFEMEDQRNWSDGSFKTYGTPASLGYPHNAKVNQRFFQKVTVRVDASQELRERSKVIESNSLELKLGETTDHSLAKIGFEFSKGSTLNQCEITLLSRLRPSHLKAEVHLQNLSWSSDLDAAIAATKLLKSTLELALFLSEDTIEAIQNLDSMLNSVPVARVLVFNEAEASDKTTSSYWMEAARQHLSGTPPSTHFIGGTNGNFAELNRQRPDISAMDGVCHTINPQVHLTDERTLIEAIQGQGDTVTTTRHFCPNLPIAISSVTLKPPFNQAAREEEHPQNPSELPANVDQRQMSLCAAAWTVASIGTLSKAGADSITYYESTGWRLIENQLGSLLPDEFHSFPGMIFPVYWVFEFLAGYNEAKLMKLTSEKPLLLNGTAVRKNDRIRIMIANLQHRSQEFHLTSLPSGRGSIRRLNEKTMSLASSNPDAFLNLSKFVNIENGTMISSLEPYETLFIEIRS